MKYTKISRKKKRINRYHTAKEVSNFAQLIISLVALVVSLNPELVHYSDEKLNMSYWDCLAETLSDFALMRLVEDYFDVETVDGLKLVSAWTARAETRWDHGKDNLPIRSHWASGRTLKRFWEFAQLSEAEKLQSGYRCKTHLLDLLAVCYGWEMYAGYLNDWRLEDDSECFSLPEGFSI